MSKDVRYKTVQEMIRVKGIKTFQEIFEQIPRSTVAEAMGTNNNRMRELIKYPLQLKLVEIDKLAALFGCTADQLIKLIRAQ